MAVETNGRPTNGRPVEPAKANGRPNGHVPYQAKTLRSNPPSSIARRMIGLAARLLLWYSIITAIFRCPSSITNINSDSSNLCRPYLTAKSYIDPYAKPYYDAYVAPYVDVARPYVQKVEHNVYAPSLAFGKATYDQYGAPRVRQVSDLGQLQWEKTCKPTIENAQTHVWAQYDTYLAPHVDSSWAAVEPYFAKGRENTLHIYNTQLVPAYTAARPYMEKTYSGVREFTVKTVLPYSKSTWTSAVVLFNRTIWPQIRILYGENVEPQLLRIGERLGRYRDGKRLKAAMADVDSTSSSASLSVIASSMSSSMASAISETSEGKPDSTSDATGSDTASSKTDDEDVRQKITDDLKNWQEKFAKAADKGSEDLEQRVKDITGRQIENQVRGVGEALFVQLEDTSKAEIQNLKKKISSLVRRLPETPVDQDYTKAEDYLSKATRQAGINIKNKAQAMREWKENFDRETESLV
ncbi:MAG: hypothetical protein Q9177_002792, partial [Variospora cf. flavescens]